MFDCCAYYLVAMVLAVLVTGYMGAPLWVWTILTGAALVVWGSPLWVLITFITLAVVFNIKFLRSRLVSFFVMKFMKGILPKISDTERVALDAGVVWVEGELFSGKPNFSKMLKEPYAKLSEEEKAFVEGPVSTFCEMIDDWQIWHKRVMPQELWDYMKKEKLFGMIIPKKYGGLGFSAICQSAVVQIIGTRSVPACITVMVPNSLGPAELLTLYGTDEQKKYWLPRLATGEEIPCFALTEPEAGSDAGSMQSHGVVFKDEKGEIKIRLNWEKRYITLAAVSTVLGIAFRLYDPENLLGGDDKGGDGDLGITCALVSSHAPGVVLGRRHDPMGTPFYNCPTRGEDVVISVDEVIGGRKMVGQGWMMLMECLAAGRGVSLPSQSAGGLKLAARVVGNYGVIRRQFGLSIGKFEGIEEPMARIVGASYMLEAVRSFTCGGIDKGLKPPVVTAIAKFNATEIFRKSVNDAMDIVGGAGISLGPRNLLAHTYIACPIGITVEGANILTRTLMIFGQGALRAHPYAYQEISAVERNHLSDFDRAFWGHVGHVVQNLFRSVLLSVTRGRLIVSPVGGPVAVYYKKIAWASATFAIMTDIAMGSLGGALKLKEKITGRYADVLSNMYMAFAVLRRFEEDGRLKEDLPLVHYTLRQNLYEIQNAFEGIFDNLRVPGLTWFFKGPLRWWVGVNRLSSLPSDQISHQVARIMQEGTPQRQRLSEGMYISDTQGDALNKLDTAFDLIQQTQGAERKIKKAIKSKILPKSKRLANILDLALEKGIISEQEHGQIQKATVARLDAIQVDCFTLEEYLKN